MQSKKHLVRMMRKETRPPKGFTQWYFILEQRRLTDDLGVARLEGYENSKLDWSGGLSVNIPKERMIGPDGKELPLAGDWDKIPVGQSTFMMLTFESRGKTMWENVGGFVKRSFSEGKLQDLFSLPWGKS